MFIHSPPPPPAKAVPLTIFVHGTQMHALVTDRDVRAYFPAETQTPTGLTTAEDLPATHQVSRILHTLAATDCDAFPFEGMYAFGWSGSIEVEERRSASKALFDLIQSLAQAYDQIHHAPPEITIITHSHGGNVVLHMTEWSNSECYTLKQTILLACPIQERTASYSSNPFFNTIYSLHSHHDLGQTLDQESLQHLRTAYANRNTNIFDFFLMLSKEMPSTKWKLGSGRHFDAHLQVKQAEIVWQSEPQHAPEAIEQGLLAEIGIYKAFHLFSDELRGVMHTEFTTPLFFTQIPFIMRRLDEEWAHNGPLEKCLKCPIAAR